MAFLTRYKIHCVPFLKKRRGKSPVKRAGKKQKTGTSSSQSAHDEPSSPTKGKGKEKREAFVAEKPVAKTRAQTRQLEAEFSPGKHSSFRGTILSPIQKESRVEETSRERTVPEDQPAATISPPRLVKHTVRRKIVVSRAMSAKAGASTVPPSSTPSPGQEPLPS